MAGDGKRESVSGPPHSRWRKQSYLKQRRQKSVWKECRDCSRCTDLALGPSMFGVHWGGSALGSDISVSSRYLVKKREVRVPSKGMFALRKCTLSSDSHREWSAKGEWAFFYRSWCITKWVHRCNYAGLGVCLKVKGGKDLINMVLE